MAGGMSGCCGHGCLLGISHPVGISSAHFHVSAEPAASPGGSSWLCSGSLQTLGKVQPWDHPALCLCAHASSVSFQQLSSHGKG